MSDEADAADATVNRSSRLFISFSGGETSALMTRLLLTRWRDRYDEVVVLFANTGQENEQTLEFVKHCDDAFGFNTVWLEAAPQRGRGLVKHKVVTFETASRNGEPFEQSIALYGIHNAAFPGCTKDLKLLPITHYLRSIGWNRGAYDTAVGIRADESNRRKKDALAARYVYPLMDWMPVSKHDVNAFWFAQPFRLNLAGYQGNCKTCWKKSTRKLMTIMDETPEHFDFFERMEAEYGLVGPEFKKKHVPGYRRTFFRGNLSVQDMREMHAAGGWARAENDAVTMPNGRGQMQLDLDDGCVESCEIDWSERNG
jgi:3'-phosphoadenosine 5'-phosphosulfate sulfotransferase (PAPS reductase)/FAD synthetase